MLRSLMSDDAVMMPPGSEWIRGKEELDKNFEKISTQLTGVDILEYVQDFEEVQVVGDYAFEWGTVSGTMRTPEGQEVHSTYHMVRILKRQEDGEWKIHRSIWNGRAPVEEEGVTLRAGRETRASPRVSHPSRFPGRTYLRSLSFAATMPVTAGKDKALCIKRFG